MLAHRQIFCYFFTSLARNRLLPVLAYIAGLGLSLADHSRFVMFAAGLAGVACLGSFLRAAIPPRKALIRAPRWPALRLRNDAPLPALLILTAFLLLGIFVGAARIRAIGASYLQTLAGSRVTAEVTVTSPPKDKEDILVFRGRVDGLGPAGERFGHGGRRIDPDEEALVQIRCPEGCPERLASLSEGERIGVYASIEEPKSSPGGDFDYAWYLRRQGIHAVLEAPAGSAEVLPGRRGGLSGLVDRLRVHSRKSLRTGEWGAATGLLQGMVLGDGHAVPQDIITDFRDSGLLHMLAVSGQNVVLLGFIVLLILRTLLVPRLAATVIAALIICVYVPLTGSGPSIVRAGVVGVLGLAALVLSRQTDRHHLLALAAAVILTLNPFSLLDPGFQLSFAAVLAIFFVAPAFSNALSFMPAALREAVAISTATGLATAPITLANFHQVSLVSVPANVAAAPVAGAVMALGVLAIIIQPVFPLLCWTLAGAASLCTGYLIEVAGFFASFPGAVHNGGPPGLLATSAFYCMLAGMAIVSKKPGFRRAARWMAGRRGVAVPIVLLLALMVGIACFSGSSGSPPDAFTVSFLDVGQGDAALIQAPPSDANPGGLAILIDGGPGSQVVDGLREQGVTRLDAVFLSHAHADHLAGLIPVLGAFPVASVYDAAPPSSSAMYRDFLRLVEKKGISYNVVREGMAVEYGELRLDVLSPGSLRPDDQNANSIVILASFRGLDILIPGDAEGEVLSALDLPRVEVYKVSHHGSRDGSLAGALDEARPEIAVISVAAENPYGHPSGQTLETLKEAGAAVYRTDVHGTVKVWLDGDGFGTSTEK